MALHAHHRHHDGDFTRAFVLGIALNVGFVVVEVIFGFTANSMALLADAGHNASDALGLMIAWAGALLTGVSATPRFSYGFKKASILSAVINALFLVVAVGAIGAEAVRRLFHPAATDGKVVALVAAAGIVVNGVTAWLFARGRKHDINIRAAFLHMATDALVSVTVVVAGMVILWTGLQWVDPAMSIAVAAVILWASIGLMKESVGMSLMGVPSGIDLREVENALGALGGVEEVHDLHIWPLSTTETALTAHLVLPEGSTDEVLQRAHAMLRELFKIEHCTLQIERVHQRDTDC